MGGCYHWQQFRITCLAQGHNDRWDLNRQPFGYWTTRSTPWATLAPMSPNVCKQTRHSLSLQFYSNFSLGTHRQNLLEWSVRKNPMMQHKHHLSGEGGREWGGSASVAMTVPLKITQHRLFGGCFFSHSWHTDSGSKNAGETQVGVFQHLKYHRGTKNIVSVGWGTPGKQTEKRNFIIKRSDGDWFIITRCDGDSLKTRTSTLLIVCRQWRDCGDAWRPDGGQDVKSSYDGDKQKSVLRRSIML